MRNKLIDRIHSLADSLNSELTENLANKSNDELLDLFAELIVESYHVESYQQYVDEQDLL